jgi:hypothetical protein
MPDVYGQTSWATQWWDGILTQMKFTPDQLSKIEGYAKTNNNVVLVNYILNNSNGKLTKEKAQSLANIGTWVWNHTDSVSGTGTSRSESMDVNFKNMGFTDEQIAQLKEPGTSDDGDRYSMLYNQLGIGDAASTSTATGTSAADQQSIDGIMRELQTQYAQLTGDINSDPTYRSLMKAGIGAGQYAADARGISSSEGLGLRGVERATAGAVLPYAQSRQQLAQNTLSLANQRDIGLGNLQLGQQQLQLQAQQMNNQTASAQAAYAQQQNQGMGSMVGAALGTAAGAYFGNPMAGYQLGSSLGGAVGGMVGTGGTPSLGTYQPKYGGYSGGWGA